MAIEAIRCSATIARSSGDATVEASALNSLLKLSDGSENLRETNALRARLAELKATASA